MTHHNNKIQVMKQVVEVNKFENTDQILDWINEEKQDNNIPKFKNQQTVMDLVVHACDISNPCRSFEIAKEWTYLLFEEFFEQGDIEREHNLPISMLCDR